MSDARIGEARRAQMRCETCSLNVLAVNRDDLDAAVIAKIEAIPNATVTHGLREGCRMLLGRSDEEIICPSCGGERFKVFPRA